MLNVKLIVLHSVPRGSNRTRYIGGGCLARN